MRDPMIWPAASLALAAAGVASAQNYQAIELEGLPGAFNTQPWCINDLGHVGGESATSTGFGFSQAVIWFDEQPIFVTGSGSYPALVRGLNDQGFAAGTTNVFADTNGFFKEPNGEPMALPTLGFFCGPADVNESGLVVGSSHVLPAGNIRAVKWLNGVLEDLGALDGMSSSARAVNDAGIIVGQSNLPVENRFVAVMWISGGIQVVADLGGSTAMAHDINEHNDVVGEAALPQGPPFFGQSRAFLWTGGEPIELATLDGGSTSAYAINDEGVIVGASGGRAFRHQDGRMIDLNDHIVAGTADCPLLTARDVNNAGQIIALGSCDQLRAYRLDPVRVGDVDLDGSVGVMDFLALLGAWGGCGEDPLCPADGNRDGVVDVLDFLALLANWG